MDAQTAPGGGLVLTINHRTHYRYSGPVRFGPHRLVLRPRESHFERLLEMEVTTVPEARLEWFQDIHGNIVAKATFRELSDVLQIDSTFTIRKARPPTWGELPGMNDEEDYPTRYSGIEEAATQLFLLPTYPIEVDAVRDWMLSTGILPGTGTKAAVLAGLSREVHRRIGYQRRDEAGVRSPVETLKAGRGSCRDMAVLMMEAARSVGFASRFVSGYLESSNSRMGRGSTHAWVEVYLPERGWVGYDPSIGRPVDFGHVAIGVSHHPRGVMPVSGWFDPLGSSYLGMDVAVQSKRIE